MNPIKRLQNLWRLSAYEPRTLNSEPVKEGTTQAQLIQKPPKPLLATFIPRKTKSPIEQINEASV